MNTTQFETSLAAAGWIIVTAQNIGPGQNNLVRATPEQFLLVQGVYLPKKIWKCGANGGYNYFVDGQTETVVIFISTPNEQATIFGPLAQIFDALTGQKFVKGLQSDGQACAGLSENLRQNLGAQQQMALELQSQLENIQAQLEQARKGDGSSAQITQLQAALDSATTQMKSAQIQIGTLQDAIDTLQTQNDALTQAAAVGGDPSAPAPVFLDQTKQPYLPFFQFFGSGGQMEGVAWNDPRDMYPATKEMAALVAASGYEKLNRYERLMLGWKFALGYTYEADDGDNHQLPVQTRARKRGDCEDFARVVIAFWRLLKILPDGAFNTTGSTNFGYHDWPIAYLSAEEIKGTLVEHDGPGWFIYESTITYTPTCPMPLKGSGYHVVDGLENWAFKGKVIPEQGAQFELAVGAPEPGARKMSRQDKIKKHDGLMLQWGNYHAKKIKG